MTDEVSMRLMQIAGRRKTATIDGRAERESRPLARADRDAITVPRQKKEQQFNVKIRLALYERIVQHSKADGVSLAVWLELAEATYTERYRR